MVRPPCCDDNGVKKGPWTAEEDEKLVEYIKRNGHGSWRALPKHAGLNRCGKSCRLRWANYLNPEIKRGKFSDDEERTIINLHAVLGNKWSRIATHLPGRTDNEIKNFWNTHLRKKLLQMGLDPTTHKPRTDLNQLINLSQILSSSSNIANFINPWNNQNPNNNPIRLQSDAAQLAKFQLFQNLMQFINNGSLPNVNNFTPSEGLFNGSYNNTLYNKGQTLEFEEYPNFNNGQNSLLGSIDGGLLFNGENPNLNSGNYYPLPALVSAATPQNDNVDQMDIKIKGDDFSTCSPNSTIFEAWEKLMDDETSGSYWKNILELTSSSPESW